MIKRITAAVIVTAAVACSLNAYADVYIEGDFQYISENGSVIITAYNGSDETVTVPPMIGVEPVSGVESGAFPEGCGVRTVELPDTITYVAEDAFGSGIEVVYSAEIPLISEVNEIPPDAGYSGYEGNEPDDGDARDSAETAPDDTPDAQVGDDGEKPAVISIADDENVQPSEGNTAPEKNTEKSSSDKKEDKDIPKKSGVVTALVICCIAGLTALLIVITRSRRNKPNK